MTIEMTMATVQARIFTLPGRPPFMMARDLAEFYQVKVNRIMEQVRRNIGRFPNDFIFEMTDEEFRLQITHFAETAERRRTDLTHYGFTREGALQLSAVLTGPVADEVSVIIMRTFAELERQAQARMEAMLLKLSVEETKRKPLRIQIVRGVEAGLNLDGIWRLGSASRPRLAAEARICLALGLIDRLPDGMPAEQMDIFGRSA